MKKIYSRLMAGVILLNLFSGQVHAADMLIPVGKVIGLELQNNTVTVAAFDKTSRAEAAGIQVGDRLLSIDGKPITCAEDVRTALNQSGGTITITVQRGDDLSTLRLEPEISPQGPVLGIYLRQGVSGIGTVTYYDPETNTFGTLGHGVNDTSGALLTMQGGYAYDAKIVAIRKGRSGEPGQLIGTLCAREPLGTLLRNTPQGVFGTMDKPFSAEALPVGDDETVKTGNATILSTIEGQLPKEYSVEILKIYPADRANGRNLLIKVTDPILLEATGGIVQGMSGSPIIQDGKLVGAVTHVLVNDPTTGYGIFIENMLDAAA